jgi:hypothetical protein
METDVLPDLIRKDLILSRNAFLWTGLPFLVYLAIMASEPRVPVREYLVLSAVLCALMPVSVFAREDKFKAAPLTFSLPATRRATVRARYALAAGCGASGMAVALALAMLWPWSRFEASVVLDPPTILFAFTAVVGLASLLMPLVFRFGLFGLIWFLVALQVLGVAATLAATLTGSLGVRPVLQVLGRLVEALHVGLGAPLPAAAVLVGLAGLAAGSMRVSEWLSERRDL